MTNSIIRVAGTDESLEMILTELQAHRFEGPDAVKILNELHGAILGSAYMDLGSVNLEDVADRMGQEIRAFQGEEVS